jgi:hypothetical protein
MLDAVMAVVVVLVGAAATFAFGQWRAERARRDVLLRRYLAQLQDSCESLWFRLKNIAYESADIATDEEYLVTTTMYTLGRALGIERMLAIEGLYPEIWRRFPQLRSALVPRVVDSAVAATTRKARTEQGRELQQYDRITLGEATVVRDGDGFRQSTFLEFRLRVEGEATEQLWWNPARASVLALRNSNDMVKPLMAAAKRLSLALSAVTSMQSALAEEADPHAEGVEEQ